jgi:hypothetical protein
VRYSELRGLPATTPPPPPPHAAEVQATPAKSADPKAGQAATPAQPATPSAKAGG